MDILSFGLDVKSFDAKKKKTLQEFKDLFDQLSKYDGRNISPVALPGLADFNKSVKESTALLDQLNKKLTSVSSANNQVSQSSGRASNSNKTQATTTKQVLTAYEQLELTLKRQALAYQNIVLAQGKTSAAAKAMQIELAATAAKVATVDKALDAASSGGVDKLSRSLTHGLSILRTVAYILPGLGIAGIFNLIGDAIGEIVTQLGIMKEGIVDVAKREEDVNNHLKEQLELYKSIYEQKKKTADIISKDSVESRKRSLSVDEARGIEKGTLLKEEQSIAEQRFIEAGNKIELRGDISETVKEISQLTTKQTKLANDIKELNKIIDSKSETTLSEKIGFISTMLSPASPGGQEAYKRLKSKKVDGVQYNITQEEFEAIIKVQKSELELDEKLTKQKIDNLNEFIDASGELSRVTAERIKFEEDQQRKFLVETTKTAIALNIRKNKEILSDNRSTEEEKKKALREIKNFEDQLSDINRYNITGNNSSTNKERAIAENKFIKDNETSRIELSKSTDAITIEFYQRYIKAKGAISKSALEEEAIIQEKISQNLNNNLDVRLKAYTEYVLLKQRIEDIENGVALKSGSIGPFGRTNLTPDETAAIEKATATRKSNLQADSEKKVFDIVKSSLDKKLNYVEDINQLDYNENKEAYLKDLQILNYYIKEKKKTLEGFIQERKEIDNKNRILILDNEIKQGEENLRALENLRRKNFSLRLQSDQDLRNARIGLVFAQGGLGNVLGAKRNVDTKKGENDAIAENEIKVEKKIDDQKKKNIDNRIKREQQQFEDEKLKEETRRKREQEYINGFFKISDAALDAVKKVGDSIYEEKLRQLDLQKQLIEEGLNAELAAIEKSSLSQKNKVALEIQLEAQKLVNEKNAALEARKIKREQAIFDRDIAISKIILNTASGVTNAFLSGDPATAAIRAGIIASLGAIELIAARSVVIPSYAEGTPEGGHKGGLARYGEAGNEWVKKPYQSPYLVTKETIGYLPKGTDVIPVMDSPIFGDTLNGNDGWEQAKYLARAMKKNNKEIKNIFKPNIIIDGSFFNYKNQILGKA